MVKKIVMKKTTDEMVKEYITNYHANYDKNAEIIELMVEGEPRPSSRPRSTIIRSKATGKQHVHVYQKQEDRDYKDIIVESLKLQMPKDFKIIDVQFKATISIYKQIPKSYKKEAEIKLCELGYIRPNTKPDLDNYAKIILDSLNGLIYTDDKLNIDLRVMKFYSSRPRFEMTIEYVKEV